MELPRIETTGRIGTFFTQDHEALDRLFERSRALVDAARAPHGGPDRAELRAAFDAFRRGLLRHIRWEEELLFPAVEAKEPGIGHGPGRVMRLEHQAIQAELELAAQALDPETASAQTLESADRALAEIARILTEHNEKEEAIYYPMSDSLLSETEAKQLLERVRGM